MPNIGTSQPASAAAHAAPSQCEICGSNRTHTSTEPGRISACIECADLFFNSICGDSSQQETVRRMGGEGFSPRLADKVREYRLNHGMPLLGISEEAKKMTKEEIEGLKRKARQILEHHADKFRPRLDCSGGWASQKAAMFISKDTEIGNSKGRETLLLFATYNGNAQRLEAHFCKDCDMYNSQASISYCAKCKQCLTCIIPCQHCMNCTTCCACPRCLDCGARCGVPCQLCCKCGDCCDCIKCNQCHRPRKPSDVCEDCGNCMHDHCQCSVQHSINFHDGKTWPEEGKRMAGIEVEYNKVSDFRPIARWANKWRAGVHSDSSCGHETVSAPAAGKHLSKQIMELGWALEEANGSVDERCSVHVHVDARDLNLSDIRKLAYIYGTVEPVMYAIGGHRRMNNRYCKANGDQLKKAVLDEKSWPKTLFSVAYTAETGSKFADTIKHKCPNKQAGKKCDCGYGRDRLNRRGVGEARYVGMNLCPWIAGRMRRTTDATVEFRIHRNCINPDRLNSWVSMCVSLLDYAKSHTWEDVLKLPKDAARALCAVSPESAPWIARMLRVWHASTRRRTRAVKYHGKGKGWILANAA
jgi:hypothetical protein